MFSFGWLMNHLGVVLYDAFGILVGFLEKGKKQANLVNFGVLRRGVGIPGNSVGPRQAMAEGRLGQALSTLRHSEATPRRRSTPQRSSATSWRSFYSQHGNFCVFVLLCFSVASRTCLLD